MATRPTKKAPTMAEAAARLLVWIEHTYPSHAAAAADLGVQASQLSLYVNGARFPRWDVMVRFLQRGLSFNWWIAGSGPMQLSASDDPGNLLPLLRQLVPSLESALTLAAADVRRLSALVQ